MNGAVSKLVGQQLKRDMHIKCGYKGRVKARDGSVLMEGTFREKSKEYFKRLLNVKKGIEFVTVE